MQVKGAKPSDQSDHDRADEENGGGSGDEAKSLQDERAHLIDPSWTARSLAVRRPVGEQQTTKINARNENRFQPEAACFQSFPKAKTTSG